MYIYLKTFLNMFYIPSTSDLLSKWTLKETRMVINLKSRIYVRYIFHIY